MNNILVLFGILAVSQARPEAGYSYPSPQLPIHGNSGHQQLSLGESRQSSSFQQLPSANQFNQQPHQHSLSENQQSSSFQQPGSFQQLPGSFQQLPSPNQFNQQPHQHSLSENQQSSSFQQPGSFQQLPGSFQQLPSPNQFNQQPHQHSLSENQQSSSFQQPGSFQQLPLSNQFNQQPQQNYLSENQQSSSFQQLPGPSHNQYNLPSLPAPAYAQAPLSQANSGLYLPSIQQNVGQISLAPQQIGLNLGQQNLLGSQQFGQQISSYQQNQEGLRIPSQPHQIIQVAQQPHLQISQPIPHLSIQQQSQKQQVLPNLQNSQFQQNSQFSQGLPNFERQASFNQLPESLTQQQELAQNLQFSPNQQTDTPLVSKDIYVHVAPEDPQQPQRSVPQPLAPKKHYKIIFIKAPSQSVSQEQRIINAAAQQPIEEKTLVYVLVDKAQQQQFVLPTPAPTQPSKPEVYFIKYKANKGISGPGSADSQPIIEDLRKNQNQGQPINSGETTSSLFSGSLPGPSSKYGPPGYQKRSA